LHGICKGNDAVSLELLLIAAVTLFSSAILTMSVRKAALARGLLDVPNVRSSHRIPTPRGGGLAIVLAASGAFVVLYASGALQADLLIALCGGGSAVAAIGLVDDRRPLPARVRIAVHLAAAIWAVVWLGGLPAVRVGDALVRLGWGGNVLAVLGIVWTLNLFNFMDGIDGIAASEAVFVTAAGGWLLSGGLALQVPAAAWVFAAACGGFIPWNWPAARIFMGDVGSGYLGYIIAVLAMAATRANPVAIWAWLLLGGVFFVDATVTLARRSLRGERLHVAHRSHAYQWLARRWGGHLPVTSSVAAINVFGLLPLAWLAMRQPQYAVWIVVAAFIPLSVLVVAAGAGRSD
jgi:Fuc2NAc and GlcNAc transferase